VLESGDETLLELFKTDCVVEGVHFAPDCSPSAAGWKAICRCVSDMAAMGGWPTEALVTVGAPPEYPWRRLQAMYSGMEKAAREHQLGIAGGEVTSLPRGAGFWLSVSMVGMVEPSCVTPRSGGKPGDVLLVTGELGGAARGWHLRFSPRLWPARWLVQHFTPTAMMDLSDGLARDLPRLCLASGCGAEIEFASLPRRRGCSVQHAVADGEDYELLFSIAPARAKALETAWAQAFPKLKLTRIGRLVEKERGLPAMHGGWDHFDTR
jgi:thiamine-monophosphate kinase